MTFKETAIQSMFERGMFREDAEQAFEILKADPANKAMTTRWNEDVSNYPAVLVNILSLSLNRAALAWIDANCPQAWYRPLFVAGKQIEAQQAEGE